MQPTLWVQCENHSFGLLPDLVSSQKVQANVFNTIDVKMQQFMMKDKYCSPYPTIDFLRVLNFQNLDP